MDNIDKLIEKYFEGQTSLDEEKQLRAYFSTDDVADQYVMYAPMFRYFESEIKEEDGVPIEMEPKSSKRISFNAYFRYAGVAASIILLLVSGLFLFNRGDEYSKSMVYVNGVQVSDKDAMNAQALLSIENVTDQDSEILDSQISVLESFTE